MHSFDKACFDRDGGQTHILHLCDCVCICLCTCIIHIMKEAFLCDCTCTCVYAQLIRCNIWQIMFSQIWRPDTFFINGRDSYQHKVRHPFPKITCHISLSLMSQMSCSFPSENILFDIILYKDLSTCLNSFALELLSLWFSKTLYKVSKFILLHRSGHHHHRHHHHHHHRHRRQVTVPNRFIRIGRDGSISYSQVQPSPNHNNFKSFFKKFPGTPVSQSQQF